MTAITEYTADTANSAQALALLLDTPLRVALASLGEIGTALLDPAKLGITSTAAACASVSFDACAGLGQITGTGLLDTGGNRLPDAAAQALLAVVLPDGSGKGMSVGKSLSASVLRLLDLRHADRQEEEGSTGHAEICWRRRDRPTRRRAAPRIPRAALPGLRGRVARARAAGCAARSPDREGNAPACGWDEDTYDTVKQELLSLGRIVAGKGRGSSVSFPPPGHS